MRYLVKNILNKFRLSKQNLFVILTLLIGCSFIILHDLVFPTKPQIAGFNIIDFSNVFIVMLMTTFLGHIPVMVGIFGIFIIYCLVDIAFAYQVFIYYIAALITVVPITFHWYRTNSKTILFVIISSIITGLIWPGFYFYLSKTLPSPPTLLFSFIEIFIFSSIIAVIAKFCFLHLNPKKLNFIPTGKFYTCENTDPYLKLFQSKTIKLSSKVYKMIGFISVMLLIGAVGFANAYFINFESHNTLQMPVREGVSGLIYNFPVKPKGSVIDYARFNCEFVILLLNLTLPLTVLINFYAQTKIAKPIILMSQAMKDFTGIATKENQLSVIDINLLNIKTGDEIEDLYNILKDTSGNIYKYIEALRKEKELQEKILIIEEANKAKTTFLSNVSHEIRTPINAVLGLDEMIIRESSEPSIVAYANDIKSSGKTLLSLINDILDVSKIEAGKLEIIPVQYELSSVINDLVNMISVKARDKNIAFLLNIDSNIPHLLYGDEIRIKQCALNILSNAVKYTPSGSVTFNVSSTKVDNKDETKLLFTITDTGIGIKEEDMEKLFMPFERMDEKRNRNIEGTGLGISIVQNLLNMMGTSLSVKSEYGKGSTFSFEITQQVLDWEPIGDFNEQFEKSRYNTEEEYESFTSEQSKILVIDDTELNLKVIKGLLKSTLLQIQTALSGEEGLALVTRENYDLIFIDYRMPHMDGIETLHKMKELKNSLNLNTPCIALTANAVSGARELYLREGFDDYLSKPIESVKLEKMIMKYLPKDKFKIIKQKSTSLPSQNKFIDLLKFIPQINLEEAFHNCGGESIFEEALKDFYTGLESKISKLEDFYNSHDLKNYTVLVHAFKSTTRLIGVMEISAKCQLQESITQEGIETEQYKTLHSEILTSLNQLKLNLKNYFDIKQPVQEKELITIEKFSQALNTLNELIQVFDFNSCDIIIKEVDKYSIPENFSKFWNDTKESINLVDQAKATNALTNAIKEINNLTE